MDAAGVLAWLQRTGTKATRDGMARYAIPADRAFGVPVGALRDRAKILGRSHELAAALWETGWYEARMLAAFLDEPARVTAEQMDHWRGDFDNWAVCDHVCFHLFDRAPHAWEKVAPWAALEPEFGKRAAFALLWSLTVHDKRAPDAAFLACLPLVEVAAVDERNFVKKGVDMALRAVGKRNAVLRAAALEVAERLSASPEPAARWIGRSALRELRGKGSAR
jgi:3-methyladenine DNA glycosylase AlkD